MYREMLRTVVLFILFVQPFDFYLRRWRLSVGRTCKLYNTYTYLFLFLLITLASNWLNNHYTPSWGMLNSHHCQEAIKFDDSLVFTRDTWREPTHVEKQFCRRYIWRKKSCTPKKKYKWTWLSEPMSSVVANDEAIQDISHKHTHTCMHTRRIDENNNKNGVYIFRCLLISTMSIICVCVHVRPPTAHVIIYWKVRMQFLFRNASLHMLLLSHFGSLVSMESTVQFRLYRTHTHVYRCWVCI